MIGFVPSNRSRVPIRNEQGQKVAYLASQNGRQVVQSVDGKTVARILRFKNNQPWRAGATSGTFVPGGHWDEWL